MLQPCAPESGLDHYRDLRIINYFDKSDEALEKHVCGSCILDLTEMILAPALVLIPVLSLVAALAYSLPVLFGLFRKCTAEDITPEWLENFSVSTYSVMEGLLDDRDFDFLSRQSGFDLSLYRKLRRERLSIFRQYFVA